MNTATKEQPPLLLDDYRTPRTDEEIAEQQEFAAETAMNFINLQRYVKGQIGERDREARSLAQNLRSAVLDNDRQAVEQIILTKFAVDVERQELRDVLDEIDKRMHLDKTQGRVNWKRSMRQMEENNRNESALLDTHRAVPIR
jgi:hypothetical protein